MHFTLHSVHEFLAIACIDSEAIGRIYGPSRCGRTGASFFALKERTLLTKTERTITPMKNPVHPGCIVKHACLEPLGLSITEGAKVLGVSRQTLNNIVNGKSGISPEMAIRLTKAFGSTPNTWLRMQLVPTCINRS